MHADSANGDDPEDENNVASYSRVCSDQDFTWLVIARGHRLETVPECPLVPTSTHISLSLFLSPSLYLSLYICKEGT